MNTKKYIAKTFQGLEGVLIDELNALGIYECTPLKRSVAFECEPAHMMLANICLRTSLRIYMPIAEGDAKTEEDVYQLMYQVPWEDYMTVHQTFMIESIVNHQSFRNSHYLGLKAKDAVVDRFKKIHKKRPNVDIKSPDLRLQVHVSSLGKCTISIDTSGEALYKRGYKNRQTEASINECLAAGMILLTGWKGDTDFYNPMCGSATLLVEAAMIASQMPPNIYRQKWGFEQLPHHNPKLLDAIRTKLIEQIVPSTQSYYASDILASAIDIAKMNYFDAKIDLPFIHFSKADFFDIAPEGNPGLVLLNPPYNERLNIENEGLWYKKMGDMLKNYYKGHQVWIISSNKAALKKIGLKPSVRHQLLNGKLPCEFCLYPIV